MESFGDKVRAFTKALAVHLLCIFAMLVGLWWTTETRPVSMPGPVIQVDLIGPTAAPRSASVSAVKPPPKPVLPKPEPPKPELPKPEPPKIAQPDTPPPTEVQRQDQVERERVAELAVQKAEQEKKEQEERHHQEQVLLEEKKREQEDQRQKQLADIRKQREAAEKALKLEQQKLTQIEDRQRAQREKNERERVQQMVDQEAPQAQTGAGGKDDDLSARYAAAIQSAVTNNWNRPDSANPGLRCSINIVQIPGGDVISVTVSSPCNADPVTRNSIEQAVMKAAPLPYQGYEKVFQRSIRLNFKYDG
ncbi:MAG TPA: cell envelope integrity protein TolA [Rhodanobacteraceae bacterium]|jgi:colicin import membrane protein|nr:cell envelope integrity protein TolA [Rhodanobacteraceae bacterium]